MKKINFYYLLIGFIILQFISILKIDNLKGEISYLNNRISSLEDNLQNQINSIYSNVDEIINRKASLIETSEIEIGQVNSRDLTLPITLRVTPKEVSENTKVSLELDGELSPMDKKDTSFSVTIIQSIFSDLLPKLVIDENGLKKTMVDNQIGIESIKNEIFPKIYPRLLGQASMRGNIYSRTGELKADIKEVKTDIKFEKTYLLVKVDDKLISKEEIPIEELSAGYELNEQVPLKDGELSTMTLVVLDSIGLEHHYTVDTWLGGSDMQREPWLEDEHIYTGDGKLLWKQEF